MVKKYTPTVKYEYGVGMFSDDCYSEAVMQASPTGQYVHVSAYDKAMARRTNQLQRLLKLLRACQSPEPSLANIYE